MHLIVVGCGRVGAELATRLFQKRHRVTVIDPVAAALGNLPPDFLGRTLEGDALSEDVLLRAGIAQADGLAAVTNSDSLNAVVAHVARTVYHLENVVVRNYDPRWRAVHEAFGAQVVSSASWGAQRMEETLCQPYLRTLVSAGNGEVAVCEFVAPTGWQGKSLRALLPASQCLPVALTRAGRALLPSGKTRLQAGDVVLISASPEGIDTLRAQLARQGEG